MSLSSRGSSSSGGGGVVNAYQYQYQQPQQPQTYYYAYRHPPEEYNPPQQDFNQYTNQEPDNYEREDGEGKRNLGSVSVQNGAINLHIPCAFSYGYDVPVPPQPEQSSSKSSLRHAKPQCKPQPQSKCQPQKYSTGGRHKARGNKKMTSNSCEIPNESESCAPPPPFCTTVKSGQMYKAPKVPKTTGKRTENQISVVWDMHAGERIPFQAVDYGQELYEKAARNLAKQLTEQHLAEKKEGSVLSDVEDECRDYSKPKLNSTKAMAKALEKAVESLKNLPEEVEALLRKDTRFEPIITSKATRVLNVDRNSQVFKDLIPVDPNPEVKTEAENVIQAEIRRSIEATRQPSRSKDPEPKLDNFQSNSYTRIRPAPVPAPVPAPSKPVSGTSTVQNYDLNTIEEEKMIEDESNKL